MAALSLNNKVGMENNISMNKFRQVPKRCYVLKLIIHSAEGLDPPSKYPGLTRRNYRVVSRINHAGAQYQTDVVEGFPMVKWNEEFHIPLNNHLPLKSNYLSIEVIRGRSDRDPGPSKGGVVVGRLRVPLRKTEQCRRLGLTRLVDGQVLGEGHITVTTKLLEKL